MSHRVQTPGVLSPSFIRHLNLKNILERIAEDEIFNAGINQRIQEIDNPVLRAQLFLGREICEVRIPREKTPVTLTPSDQEALSEYFLLTQKQAIEDTLFGAADGSSSFGESFGVSPSPTVSFELMRTSNDTREELKDTFSKPITPAILRQTGCKNIQSVIKTAERMFLDPNDRQDRKRLVVKRFANEALLLREAEQLHLFQKFLEESGLCVADIFLRSIEDHGYETQIWKEFTAYQKSEETPCAVQVLDPKAEEERQREIAELLREEDVKSFRKKRVQRPEPRRENPQRKTPPSSSPEQKPKPSSPQKGVIAASPAKESKYSPSLKASTPSKGFVIGRCGSNDVGFRLVESPLNRSFRSPITQQPIIRDIFSEVGEVPFSIEGRVDRWFNVSDSNKIKQFEDVTSGGRPRYARMNDDCLMDQILRHQCHPIMAYMLKSSLFTENYSIAQKDSVYLKVKVRADKMNFEEDFGIMSMGVDPLRKRIYHAFLHSPSSLYKVEELVPSSLTNLPSEVVARVTTSRIQIADEAKKFREVFVDGVRFPLIEFEYTHPLLGRVILTFAPVRKS